MIDVKTLLYEYNNSDEAKFLYKNKIEALRKIKEGDQDLILLGFGGTISSGYSPTEETIVPLNLSASRNEIENISKFKINHIEYSEICLCAKDSRDLEKEDFFMLLSSIHYLQGKKILVTCGTYLLPKISELILLSAPDNTSIAVTGSILPAGFLGGDASQNIWSAITMLLNNNHFIGAVFHGRSFTTLNSLQSLNLHPEETKDKIIGYPIISIPFIN